jgi:hypothetical protein
MVLGEYRYDQKGKQFSKLSRLSWCNLGAVRIEIIDLLDGIDENQPIILEYMDTLDTMYAKDGNFYIARFEVQVLGKELI